MAELAGGGSLLTPPPPVPPPVPPAVTDDVLLTIGDAEETDDTAAPVLLTLLAAEDTEDTITDDAADMEDAEDTDGIEEIGCTDDTLLAGHAGKLPMLNAELIGVVVTLPFWSIVTMFPETASMQTVTVVLALLLIDTFCAVASPLLACCTTFVSLPETASIELLTDVSAFVSTRAFCTVSPDAPNAES